MNTKNAPGNICTASRIAREVLWVHLGTREGNNCDGNLPAVRMFAPLLFALRTISEIGGGRGADGSRSFKRQEERIMAELETSDE